MFKTCAGVGQGSGLAVGAVVVWMLSASAPVALAQAPTGAKGSVTFARDVAPVLQKNCEGCHRPGDVGPMSLRTYEEVRPWARSIKAKVVAGEMPPYRYDRIGIQDLKDDLRLSDTGHPDHRALGRWRRADREPRRHARRRGSSPMATSGPMPNGSARPT